MKDIYQRTKAFIGETKYKNLENKTVLLVGVGGVGSIIFESLVRLGVNKIIICDFDMVEETNLNRQMLYTLEDIGLSKVDCAEKRAKKINSEIEIIKYDTPYSDKIIENNRIDFIFDAIDDLPAKTSLVKCAIDNNIPFVSSLGMGRKFDSTKIKITKLNQTHDDPLAKKFRHMLKEQEVDISQVNVAFSEEKAIEQTSSFVPSIVTSPNAAGLAMVSFFINSILSL